MALLDMFKRGAKRAGENLESYIGGLLGEDLSQLSAEERRQIRRQGMSAVFDAMARGTTPNQGLAGVAQMAGARLEQKRLQNRQQAAEQEMGRITGRLFGGAPAAPADMGEDETGLGTVAIQSQYRQSPQEALARMYGTAAGRDVAQMAPGLLELAQEGTTGRTVGDAVYNPLTGKFARAEREKAKELTPEEVAKLGQPRGTIIQRKPDGTLDIISKPSSGAASLSLRQVRLDNGMVQDMWIAPGQRTGIPVGAPYSPKGEAGGEQLNARQQSGVNITRNAALQYAANIAGVSVESLQDKTPEQIEKIVREKGGRVLQGGVARMMTGLPIVGDFAKSIIESSNADLIGPSTTGGAGIAMVQNPTGPITGADVDVGIRQFPNPMLPVEVQAQMIRTILEQGGKVEKYDKNGNLIR